MIMVTSIAAQGDVLFRRVMCIPENAQELQFPGPLIVAHSETGHHHVIESFHARLFSTPNPLVSYLQFDGPFADVVHLRPFHTHETLRLLSDADRPTYFEIRRQREHSPEGWRPVQD